MHAWVEVCHLLQSSKSPLTGFLCSIGWRIRGVGNEQFWRTRFPDFSLISPWFPSKMTSYVVKVGGAGGLGWFPSLISRKSALISHDFNLISTDFSMRCTRFLSLPTPRKNQAFFKHSPHTNCISNSAILRNNYISLLSDLHACVHVKKNGVVKEAIVLQRAVRIASCDFKPGTKRWASALLSEKCCCFVRKPSWKSHANLN